MASVHTHTTGDSERPHCFTNNFLKVLSLVLGFTILASITATDAAAKHYANMKPLVIRIDGVGKTEAGT